MEHVSRADAKSILFTLAASEPTMEEITTGSDYFYNEVGDHKDMIWGAPIDKSLGDYMRVMVIATGIDVPCYIQGKRPKEFKPRGQVRYDTGEFAEV